MQIQKINIISVSHAVNILKRRGVIIYPTDTAYALGGVFDSKKVIQRIVKIKKRRDTKFPLIASSFHQVEKFFRLNAAQKNLAKKYWPGPLSIVVSPKFAIRVPDNKVARTLARRVDKPLIATSANISGDKTSYSAPSARGQFMKKPKTSKIHDRVNLSEMKKLKFYVPDLILDAGKLPAKKTSTIVRVKKSGAVEVIREGAVVLR